MVYNKDDIVKFQDPWFKLNWVDKKIHNKSKHFISGYMNPGHLNRIANKQPNQIILAEILEVKHNDLFVVQESFFYDGITSIVIKEFNSKTNLQYLAICQSLKANFTFFDNYVLLTDAEKAQLKRSIRKQKMKKIYSSI